MRTAKIFREKQGKTVADVNQGCSLSERRTNFATPSPLDGDGEGEGEYSSQQRAVGLVFAVGVVVGVVINFANLHTDFQVYHAPNFRRKQGRKRLYLYSLRTKWYHYHTKVDPNP